MTIRYVDLYNGDDSNDGSSWANAWKTVTGGATAARLVTGDEIRVSKTPDPVSVGNATWTDCNKLVELAAARTADIFDCATLWTASANINHSLHASNKKLGTHSSYFYFLAAFTTGKAAYYTLPSTLDLSAYQEISFWLKPNSAITAGHLRVVLCSDAVGDVIVDTFTLQAHLGAYYRPVTITKDGGGNLGAIINSIAIYADVDFGVKQIYFDNIIATKTGDLNLNCLISKSSSAIGSSEGFYPIQSISGTSILIDNHTETFSTYGRGYSGETETVESFIRRGFPAQLASISTYLISFTKAGTAGALTTYNFGFNPLTNEQDGLTIYDLENCIGSAVAYSQGYTRMTNVGFVRPNKFGYGGSSYFEYDNCYTVGAYSYGFEFRMVRGAFTNICVLNCNIGAYFESTIYSSFSYLTIRNNNSNGLLFDSAIGNIFDNIIVANHGGAGLNTALDSPDNVFYNYQSLKNTYGFQGFSKNNRIVNVTLTDISFVVNCGNLFLKSIDGIDGNDKYIMNNSNYARIRTDVYKEGESSSMEFYVAGTSESRMPLVEFAVVANKEVTVKLWTSKIGSQSSTPEHVQFFIRLPRNPDMGISETYVYSPDNFDWNEMVLTFTPLKQGVIKLEVGQHLSSPGYGSSFFGPISITQAD